MKITTQHVRYWHQNQRQPSWAGEVPQIKFMKVSVHSLINVQAGIRRNDGEREAHNLLNLCKYYRREGKLQAKLTELSENRPHGVNPGRRQGFARKWLKRLRRNSNQLVNT